MTTDLARWKYAPRRVALQLGRQEADTLAQQYLPLGANGASAGEIERAREQLARDTAPQPDVDAGREKFAERMRQVRQERGGSTGLGGFLKGVGSGALNVLEAVDKPLTERAGFDVGDSKIANLLDFVLAEVTRPTNLGIAAGGAGAAARIGAVAARGGRAGRVAGRIGGALVDPIATAPGGGAASRFGARLGVEAAASGGGRVGAEQAQKTGIPGAGLVGGLLGAVGGAGVGLAGVRGAARGVEAGANLADQARLAQGLGVADSRDRTGRIDRMRQAIARGPAERELEAKGQAAAVAGGGFLEQEQEVVSRVRALRYQNEGDVDPEAIREAVLGRPARTPEDVKEARDLIEAFVPGAKSELDLAREVYGGRLNQGPIKVYRGDSTAIESFDLDKAAPNALFGRGIYLTDNRNIARSYTTKGPDAAGVHAFTANGETMANPAGTPLAAYETELDRVFRQVERDAPLQDQFERLEGRRMTPNEMEERAVQALGKFEDFDIIPSGSGAFQFNHKGTSRGQVSEVILPANIGRLVIDVEQQIQPDHVQAIRRAFDRAEPSLSEVPAAHASRADRFMGAARVFAEGDPEIRRLRHGDGLGAAVESSGIGSRPKFADLYKFAADLAGPDDWDVLEQFIREELTAAGFHGLRYDGGARLGGINHNAYVLWDAEAVNAGRSAAGPSGYGPIGGGSQLAFGTDPGPLLRQIYGAEPIELGLSKYQEAANHIKGMLKRTDLNSNEIATPALAERKRLLQSVDSVANVEGARARQGINDAFTFDDTGIRIAGLDNVPEGAIANPTIQDLAARYPLYEDLLDDEQRAMMEELRNVAKYFKGLLVESGIENAQRADVIEGGFYLPRGNAANELADAPTALRGGGKRAGARAGFEKAATFDSMVEGIEKGYVYPHAGESFEHYVKDVGTRSVDTHIANYFKTIRDPSTGKLIHTTPAARMLQRYPETKIKMDGLKRRLVSLRATGVRLSDRTDDAIDKFIANPAPDLDDLADAMHLVREEDVIVSAAFNLDDLPSTREFAQQIEAMRAEIRYTPAGALSESKANIATMRRVGELEALDDIQGITRHHGPNTDAALVDLEDHWRKLGEEVDSRRGKDSTGAPTLGNVAPVQKGESSRFRHNVGKSRLREVGSAEDSFEQLLQREETFTRFMNDAGLDRQVHQPATAEIMEALGQSVRRTAERLKLRVGRSATGAEGINYGKTRAEIKADIVTVRGEIDELRPTYKHQLATVTSTPAGDGAIDFQQLSGSAFPLDVANAANRVLRGERKAIGRGAGALEAVEALNTILRGLRATADLSFMGIQGLIGLVTNPVGYSRALGVAYRAITDPDVAGSAIRSFDEREAARGFLGTDEWARVGLHQAGVDTEFAVQGIGEGLSRTIGDTIGKAPIVKQSNRSFGLFGDAMRREQASTFLEVALEGGKKQVADLTDDELRGIARAANLGTGWGPGKFGGTWGDFVMFAPRFFQSQLDLVIDAATKGTIDGQLARRSVTRLIGTGLALTFAANAALGNKTEVNPFGDNSSNFMRVRMGGRDYSIFGPWDSLLRVATSTISGIVEGKPFDGPAYLARSKSSPAVGMVWDWWTGETFKGDDPKSIEQLALNLVPFSLQESKEIAGDFAEGNIGRGLAGIVGETSGLKSSPVTANEQLDQVAQRMYGRGFWILEPHERENIKGLEPELWSQSVARGKDQRQRAEGVRTQVFDAQLEDDQTLLGGDLTRNEWRDQRDTRRDQQRALLENIYGDREDREPQDPDNEYKRYLGIIDRHSNEGGEVDWDAVDLEVATLPTEVRAEILKSVGVGQTPLSKAYQQLIGPYYDIGRYRGYSASESREIDFAWTEVTNRAGEHKLSRLRQIRRMQDAGQLSDTAARALKLRTMGRSLTTNPDRAQYRQENQVLDVLLRSGTLTPADQAILAGFEERAS